jgi:hypothetical protein
VHLHKKVPALLSVVALVAAGAAVGTSASAAVGDRAAAGSGKSPGPKVVRLSSTDSKTNLSDTKFRPGVTEFKVTKTARQHSTIVVLESKNLKRTFTKIQKAFQGGPGSADAMATVDRITTFYSGAATGERWQVKLSKGHYYAIDTRTNNVTPFRVKGERRGANMAHAPSEVTATKQNMWRTSGTIHGKWLRFTNNAHEIHFLEGHRVKNDTNDRDIQKWLKTNKGTFFRKGGFFFDVTSPGVSAVHRVDLKTGKHVIACFMPSEEQDGVPHALMGMWKLVQVKG